MPTKFHENRLKNKEKKIWRGHNELVNMTINGVTTGGGQGVQTLPMGLPIFFLFWVKTKQIKGKQGRWENVGGYKITKAYDWKDC